MHYIFVSSSQCLQCMLLSAGCQIRSVESHLSKFWIFPKRALWGQSFLSSSFLWSNCDLQKLVWQPTVINEAQLLRPIAQAPMYALATVLVNGALFCPADRAGVHCVIEDLVLFVYSVQPGYTFHWLLGLYTQLGPTSNRYTEWPEFHPPSQSGRTLVGDFVTWMQCIACSHLLSNSRRSLPLRCPYSWV